MNLCHALEHFSGDQLLRQCNGRNPRNSAMRRILLCSYNGGTARLLGLHAYKRLCATTAFAVDDYVYQIVCVLQCS